MHKQDYTTIIKHAKNSESESKLNSMIKLAQSEAGIAVNIKDLDANSYLFNCTDATIDLKTGKVLTHAKEHLITKISGINYIPDATCPLWINFLNKIMNGNSEMIEFLQRTVGYSLTGDASEQCMFILQGNGANGKSTFIETLKSLFGDYAKVADPRTFLVNQSNGIRNDLARLCGVRFVSSSEADEGSKLSESIIKQFTGSDTIAARFLHKEFFEFQPVCKIFLATNYKPIINGEYAIWRRIRLIPFKRPLRNSKF